jgi:uncharacterized protein (DUF2141 family)
MKRLAAVLPALALACPATAGDLHVRVVDLRSDSGRVHVAIYDDPARFPKDGGYLADRIVPAARGEVSVVFPDLSPGLHAVATYHDENGNGRFDQGALGISLEGYAFSNDVRPFLAAPDFDDAAVPVPRDGREIVIRMKY